MIGKTLRVNDYKFTYGQETAFVNMYGVFKSLETGNKYAIYSYENGSKLFYGAFFQRNNEAVIMTSKEDPKDIVKQFVDLLLKNEMSDNFEIISLDEINSIQVIEEYTMDGTVDVNKLYDLTIPKSIEEEVATESKKKPMSIAGFFFALFVVVVIAFFIAHPEVIVGENTVYSCTKSYFHNTLPASINEVLDLTFNGRGEIINIDLTADYVFNDIDYFEKFKEKSYFYQYMEEGDTYKLIDEAYTYRLFSKIDITGDFFLPTEESELIAHYKENKYTCKVVEVNE